jgi:hypothetical protein
VSTGASRSKAERFVQKRAGYSKDALDGVLNVIHGIEQVQKYPGWYS